MKSRKCLWFFWIIMGLITGGYCAVSLLTFSNVYKAYDKAEDDEPILAVLAATFFGSVLVFMYGFVSFCTLLGKTAFRSGAGFSYGFITSSSIHMALMCLLCGLVLNGFKDQVRTEFENDTLGRGIDWSKVDTTVFVGTFIMSYASTVAYLLFFIILVCEKGAVHKSEHVAMSESANKV